MRTTCRNRGVALVAVLMATALLLVLVAVLVDIGTLQLQKATADLRALQALGGADAGAAWVRAVFEQQSGDLFKTVMKLGASLGRRRFVIDDRTYVVVTEILRSPGQQSGSNIVDDNLEQYPRATEQPIQIESSATVYVDAVLVSRRVTTTLLRVFPAAPYSEVVGYIDNGAPVGIDSPGDAGGQAAGPNATELLVHAYQMTQLGDPQKVDQFNNGVWSDGNPGGSGPLP